jgi:sialic acid synthase SpsE
VVISGIQIGRKEKPFVIAEFSGNHNGELNRALALVEAAARTGVPSIKLQTYRADRLTLDVTEGEFVTSDPKSQ